MDGKRVSGEVGIHQNGLRYIDHRGSKIDVLFSNVKHLFFQPCTHELIVIIHVHLKNPIMIGKKKAKDVQFYREATDMQFDETATASENIGTAMKKSSNRSRKSAVDAPSSTKSSSASPRKSSKPHATRAGVSTFLSVS